jgi:hypothetical protein
MQMYSSRRADGEVRYERLLGHRRSGAVEVLVPEEHIGILSDGRYRWLLAGVFEPGDTKREDAFFRALGVTYRGARDPLTAFGIQPWRWSFVAHPRHPERSELVAVRRIEIASPPDASEPSR